MQPAWHTRPDAGGPGRDFPPTCDAGTRCQRSRCVAASTNWFCWFLSTSMFMLCYLLLPAMLFTHSTLLLRCTLAPGEEWAAPIVFTDSDDDDVPAAAPERGSTPPASTPLHSGSTPLHSTPLQRGSTPVGDAAAATGAARHPTDRRKSLLQPDSTPPGGGETKQQKKCRMDRNRQRIAALEAEAERVEEDQRRQLCATVALFRVYACLSARV